MFGRVYAKQKSIDKKFERVSMLLPTTLLLTTVSDSRRMRVRSTCYLSAWVTFILIYSTSQAERTNYNGYKVYRFLPNNDVVNWINELEAESFKISPKGERMPVVDVLSTPHKYRSHMDVIVAPEFSSAFLAMLQARGVSEVDVIAENIQKDIDRERRYVSHRRHRRHLRSHNKADGSSEWTTGPDSELTALPTAAYHRYDKIVGFLQLLSKRHPELVGFLNITKTFEGRDLVGVQIGKRGTFKPAIFVDAGIHAREWIAPAVALFMINRLVNDYGKDAEVTYLLNKFDWFIIPVANPDGYEYSMTTDRLWRKTRSKNETVNKWCVGTDANRNWGYRWGEAGANRSPCSNVYAGAKPFSEPEVAGLRELINWQIPDLKIYASLHSYGQLFLSPWGYTIDKPPNYDDQKMAAELAVDAIKNHTGKEYNYGTIAELMYPASGTSIDYMQHREVPYIYGIELRPEDLDTKYGFTIPPEFIEPTGEEILIALKKIAGYAVEKKRI